VFVGFMIASTGGLLDFVSPEPCSPTESATAPDDKCPATCVRCHCARAFDLTTATDVSDRLGIAPESFAPRTVVLLPNPHDILHVPRPSVS